MKEIRPSRDEARRTRTAHEKETRRRHKAASAKKTATFRDLPSLVRLVVTGQEIDVDDAVHCLHYEVYYGGIAEADFAATIFAPALTDLTQLPMGILDQKEELLPGGYLPDSIDALRDYAERMISASRNQDLIETIAEGWPGHGHGDSRLTGHLANLWQIHIDHPPLHRALVMGRHRPVIQALRDRRYAGMSAVAAGRMQEPDTLLRIRRALECQTLLWCAHDVQMILARNASAAAFPLGDLLSSDKTLVEPTTVLAAARPTRETLMAVLDAYQTYRESGINNRAINTLVEQDSFVRRLRRQVELEAAQRGIDTERAAERVAMLMDRIASRVQGANDEFLHALAAPARAYAGPKSFHVAWFSGLSQLASSGVAVIRYLQAEAQVAALIDELLPLANVRLAVRDGLALPAFTERNMPKGWKARSRDLLHAWRSGVLGDQNLHSRSVPTDGRDTKAGKQPLEAAIAFLNRAGDRRIGDDHGDQHCERRTFYLLDVIPEHRLACG